MMYKIVIVDDNPTTVLSLSQCFDWEQLGLELVGTAFDGVQGKELILRTQPDIVITDINMPEIDGLSMIEQVVDVLSAAKIIVITGYDEFQYASRAIKLSVFDFILKPIDDSELQNSLVRALKSLEEERSASVRLEQMREYTRRAQMLSLLTASDAHDTSVSSLVQKYGIEFASYFVIVAQCRNGVSQPLLRRIDTEDAPGELKVITLIIEDAVVLFCMCEFDNDGWHKMAERIAARLLMLEPEFTIAISNLHHSYHHIRAAYQEAKWMVIESSLLDAYGYIRFFNEGKDNKSARIIELEQKCQDLAQDINQAETLFLEVYRKMDSFTNGDLLSLRLMLFHYCTIVLHEYLPKDKWSEMMDKTVYCVVNVTSAQGACDYLERFFFELNKAGTGSGAVSALVCKVLYYIKMNAIEGLRLEDVAEKFFVSPNYLSALIKKETGIKYQQHVLNAKMNVAKKLLNDTRMGIEEIAHAVGYENYVSFYNMFKRFEGRTPTEYRLRSSLLPRECE